MQQQVQVWGLSYLPNCPSGLRCAPQLLRAAIAHCRQEVWVPCGGSPARAHRAHKQRDGLGNAVPSVGA